MRTSDATAPSSPFAAQTRKGRATRERIVVAAAALMYEHGVAGTSTPAIRDAAHVSSSQIYHYFADKDALTRAVIAFQTESILAGQGPLLGRLDGLEALRAWRDVVIDAARRARGAGGCPLGSLSAELSDEHAWARESLSVGFRAWAGAIRDGLAAMTENGTLRPDAPVDQLAQALLVAVQGGLVLAQVHRDTTALAAGLDVVLAQVSAYAA